MSNSDYKEFLQSIQRVNEPKQHKITGSLGAHNSFYFYRRKCRQNEIKPMPRKDFDNVTRLMNELVVRELFENKSVKLPRGLGRLMLMKEETTTDIDENGNLICNKPIDMKRTLELWYNDEEARANRTKVRFENDYVYRLKFHKSKINNSNNFRYFSFSFNRTVKRQLKDIINNDNKFDTYEKRKFYNN